MKTQVQQCSNSNTLKSWPMNICIDCEDISSDLVLDFGHLSVKL